MIDYDFSELQQLVGELRYKPGWHFWLRSGFTESSGVSRLIDWGQQPGTTCSGPAILHPPVFLIIEVETKDSTDPTRSLFIRHSFSADLLPHLVSLNWRRWLLDRILDVERHEAMEFFAIGDDRPFYPDHGPDAQLYMIKERAAV